MNLDELACEHCKGLLSIRMPVPSSKCDHLYYPECCEICTELIKNNRLREERKRKRLK